MTIEPAFSVLNVEPSARRERPEKHAGVGCVIVEGPRGLRPYCPPALKMSLVSCPIALYPATSEREKFENALPRPVSRQYFRKRFI